MKKTQWDRVAAGRTPQSVFYPPVEGNFGDDSSEKGLWGRANSGLRCSTTAAWPARDSGEGWGSRTDVGRRCRRIYSRRAVWRLMTRYFCYSVTLRVCMYVPWTFRYIMHSYIRLLEPCVPIRIGCYKIKKYAYVCCALYILYACIYEIDHIYRITICM